MNRDINYLLYFTLLYPIATRRSVSQLMLSVFISVCDLAELEQQLADLAQECFRIKVRHISIQCFDKILRGMELVLVVYTVTFVAVFEANIVRGI